MWRHLVVVALVLAIILASPATTLSEPSNSNFQLSGTLAPVVFPVSPSAPNPNTLFTLANHERQAQGSPPLRANLKLADIATARTADMIARQYYAHKAPDGRYYYDAMRDKGLNPNYSCENLDLVFVPTEQMVISEWLGSLKGHRECLLDPSLVEAGYAAAKLTLVDYDGQQTAAYVIVAIHSTPLWVAD